MLPRALRSFATFWYEFIIGDDWTVTAGVVIALALTAVLSRMHLPAWWLPPLAALILLAMSLRRAARRHDAAPPPSR